MPTPHNWKELLRSIERCNAVYATTKEQAFSAFSKLGNEPLFWYSDDMHQAVVCKDQNGDYVLSIAGTRVTDGTWLEKIGDLYEDIDFRPIDYSEGLYVAAGALDRSSIYAWAVAQVAPNTKWKIEGHSLGGQTTHLAPIYIHLDNLISMTSWEPPKAANAAYYDAYTAWFDRCETIVNGKDPWAAWPWIEQELRHPTQLLWLHDNTWSDITYKDWPGGEALHLSDHNTDQVLLKVKALVTT